MSAHYLKHGLMAIGTLALLWGCAEDATSSGGRGSSANDGNGGITGGTGGGTGGETGGDPFIPEEEVEIPRDRPQGGERYVFVASSGLDAVVRIDALTLAVDLIEVGGDPRNLRVLPGTDDVLVFNAGTRDFSLIRAGDDEPVINFLDAPDVVNELVVDASGRWAVGWYNPDGADPAGDLQEVLVVSLKPGAEAVYPVGVGFHPQHVSFDLTGETAYVVTDDGVSIIQLESLSGPAFAKNVLVADDPFEKPFDREVLVTPDGQRAVVRRGGEAELRIVQLPSGEATVIALSGPPTDVDLSIDASEAFVTIRDTSELVRVPLDDPEANTPIALSGTPAGLAATTDDGERVVLYSSLPGARWLAVLELKSGDVTAWPLQKEVKAVLVAPDNRSVVVLHRAETVPEDASDLERIVGTSEGYSVVDLDTGFAKLQLSANAPAEVTLVADPARAYVLIPDASGHAHTVDAIDLTSLLPVSVPLGSPPTHAVYVPAAARVAVSQEHPVGRITFIGVDDGATETVTGFELNGLIE